MEHGNLNYSKTANSDLGAVSGSAIKPPLGLIPKKFHDEQVKVERFNEVCGAIARYYDAGMKINIEWIEEYNELVESVGRPIEDKNLIQPLLHWVDEWEVWE